jgi:hypothetical protein
MITKWWNFKRIVRCGLLSLMLGLLPEIAWAGDEVKTEAEMGLATDSVSHKYDKRVHRYVKGWENLIPTHSKIQYAGGMGLISVGMGWDYGKHRQWETDLLFGYLPRYSTRHCKMTMTLKQNFIPWSTGLGKNLALEPLTTGLYFNTVFSDKFWTSEPDRYPKGYYGFSTRVRTHIFVGQRLRYDLPDSKYKWVKSVTAFYELSSCDLYIVSAFTNRYLKPADYLRLSFGLKFQIF